MHILDASPVEKAALTWWRSKRPLAWSEAEHLANPKINTVLSEQRVALAVAKALKARGVGSLEKARRP